MRTRSRPPSHGRPVAMQVVAGVAFSMLAHVALVVAAVVIAHRASMVTLEQACMGFGVIMVIDLAFATIIGRTGPFAMRMAMLLTVVAAGFATYALMVCGALLGP